MTWFREGHVIYSYRDYDSGHRAVLRGPVVVRICRSNGPNGSCEDLRIRESYSTQDRRELCDCFLDGK